MGVAHDRLCDHPYEGISHAALEYTELDSRQPQRYLSKHLLKLLI